MGLNNVDLMKRKQEDEITQKLFSYIDKKQSLVFEAGAGAGKTYALIESLRYVIKKYGKILEENSQQIMCITYTNVAAKNIKGQLGSSKRTAVSTIHERLWQLIAPYQEQLLFIHKEKVKAELKKDLFILEEDIESEKIFGVYRDLSEDDRKKFGEAVWERREEFYQKYDLNAASFKSFYETYIPGYIHLMNNVGHFKRIVTKIYAIRQNRECLDRMTSKEQGYRKVEYNARYNQDRLYKMRISHDTLLEYSKKMVELYPRLQQIIIDKYPYIFIDEYQDTAEEVVEIMAVLENRGREIGHTAFIGYYGDSIQSIYDYGVGEKITKKHPGLKEVYKPFNRRSYEEIIKVANKIRLDGLQQESIFADCKGGKVEYCTGHSFNDVLGKCRNEWKNEADSKIHCFLLKNEEVAEKIGISRIYNVFKGAKVYTGSNYKQLNTELLSNDREKLGKAASFLYRILKLYTDIREDETPVEEILYGDISKYINLDIQQLKDIKLQLMEIKGDTLGDIINKMCECCVHGDINVKMIIKAVLDTETVSYPYIIAYLVQALNSNRVQDEGTEASVEDIDLDKVRQLLAIDIKEFEKWFYYIERKWQGEIIYHTYHGTKGLEFGNVLIVLEDGFGTSAEDRTFIKTFLENYGSLDGEKSINDYKKARNLLYVAVTRAIKNLKVTYEGESRRVEETLAKIFNEQTTVETTA